MKVILLKNIEKLGRKGEVKEVTSGYARNFLLVKNLATLATASEMAELEKQKEIEKKVTSHIQKNFSFVVFEVKNKNERLTLELKIISTINQCKDCRQSKTWLGNFSPKEKIRRSGLWLVNELFKTPLNSEDFQKLKVVVK